jgi:beta-1,4-mannosyl-glycoprotein beta-1,4-N-acetylglucosaminyltransferase
MEVFDCFIFNDELEIIDIRFHTLDKFTSKFVIVESNRTHQGGKKNINFNIKYFKKFEKKIIYLLIDDTSILDKNKNDLNSWIRENNQRNFISKGLQDCSNDDIILISDADEIPNLTKINLNKLREKVYAFEQLNYMYKLNLLRSDMWIGTKLCKYKYLKSPQWLRSLKVHKKYSYLRIDKVFINNYIHNFKIIKNGGWHFGWMKKPKGIINKLNSFAHTEFNKKEFKKKNYINDMIKNKINFLNDEPLKIVQINKSYPTYIYKNLKKFSNWITK